MSSTLPSANNKSRVPIALAGSALLAVFIFLLIPITQHLDNLRGKIIDFRETMTLAPPPPMVIPPAPEQVQQNEPEPPPEFERQLQNLSLNQLELNLNPGISDALKIGLAGGGFVTEVDAVSDIQKLFTFADLQEAPRIINRPNFVYPNELARRGVRQGKVIVKIEINEKGRARILKVVSTTHPGLVGPAKEIIRQARFTPPKVDGVAQKVIGEWPINLKAP